jgi:hypothetical protein
VWSLSMYCRAHPRGGGGMSGMVCGATWTHLHAPQRGQGGVAPVGCHAGARGSHRGRGVGGGQVQRGLHQLHHVQVHAVGACAGSHHRVPARDSPPPPTPLPAPHPGSGSTTWGSWGRPTRWLPDPPPPAGCCPACTRSPATQPEWRPPPLPPPLQPACDRPRCLRAAAVVGGGGVEVARAGGRRWGHVAVRGRYDGGPRKQPSVGQPCARSSSTPQTHTWTPRERGCAAPCWRGSGTWRRLPRWSTHSAAQCGPGRGSTATPLPCRPPVPPALECVGWRGRSSAQRDDDPLPDVTLPHRGPCR